VVGLGPAECSLRLVGALHPLQLPHRGRHDGLHFSLPLLASMRLASVSYSGGPKSLASFPLGQTLRLLHGNSLAAASAFRRDLTLRSTVASFRLSNSRASCSQPLSSTRSSCASRGNTCVAAVSLTILQRVLGARLLLALAPAVMLLTCAFGAVQAGGCYRRARDRLRACFVFAAAALAGSIGWHALTSSHSPRNPDCCSPGDCG